MAKLAPVTRNELVQGLRRLGFDGPYSGGKHEFMLKDELRLTLPNPHKREIGVDLLRRILRQAGITRDEWLASQT